MYLSICSLIPASSHPGKEKKRRDMGLLDRDMGLLDRDMGLLELSGTENIGVIATGTNVCYRHVRNQLRFYVDAVNPEKYPATSSALDRGSTVAT
jgi:hypothetical protein